MLIFSSSTCITVEASDVDLKLNGHTITGPGDGSDGAAGVSPQNNNNTDLVDHNANCDNDK